MSILTTWLSKVGAEMSVVEHAAMHLISAVANGQANLQELESDHPLVGEAITAGTAAAVARGVPVLTIEQTVIALAKEMTAAMSEVPATPVAEPAAPAPTT
jgi:hypothetical protein